MFVNNPEHIESKSNLHALDRISSDKVVDSGSNWYRYSIYAPTIEYVEIDGSITGIPYMLLP